MNKFPTYEELVDLVNKILSEAGVDSHGNPKKMTLRQIYYKLVVLKVFENIQSNYKLLSARLVTARERGDVDDSRIEDRARQVRGGDYSLRNPEEYYEDHETSFRNSWREYSRPFWLDQEDYCEVFVEKDSLSGVVSSVANEYRVVTCVNRGYSSYSYLNKAVERILRNCAIFHPEEDVLRCPHILYMGDRDPSGDDMLRDLDARLRKYGLGKILPENYELVRKIAVTSEQIKEYNLPTIPLDPKKAKDDRRSKKFLAEFGEATVELDVFDNETLESLVKTAIEEYIDPVAWNRHQDASEREREELRLKIERHFEGNT